MTAAVPPSAPARPFVRPGATEEGRAALPVVPVRARGLTVDAADGRRYLDCLAGGGAFALGHNHPVVLDAVRGVLASGQPMQAPGPASPVEEAFVAELLGSLPPELSRHARVRFCPPAGQESIRAAAALVRAATGNEPLLALGPGHGPLRPGRDRVVCAPYPSGGRSGRPGADDQRSGPATELALQAAQFQLDAVAPAAGVLVECLRRDGVVSAPDPWVRGLRDMASRRGLPFVADEMFSGAGRTGTMWAFERSGVVPDVLVLAQAVGGGLPLAALVHHADLDPGTAPGPCDAFRGNQLALAAGGATLAHIRREGLASRAAEVGSRMLNALRAHAAALRHVGDVRGRGLLLGVELVDPARESDDPGAARPCPRLAGRMRQECLRRGLIVGLTGPEATVVTLTPPLTLTDEQAAAVLERFADALDALDASPSAGRGVPGPGPGPGGTPGRATTAPDPGHPLGDAVPLLRRTAGPHSARAARTVLGTGPAPPGTRTSPATRVSPATRTSRPGTARPEPPPSSPLTVRPVKPTPPEEAPVNARNHP